MAYTPIKKFTEKLDNLIDSLQHLKILSNIRGNLADIRVNLTGGTLTGGTLNSVSTVNTLTNQTQIGSYQANQQIPAIQNMVSVLSNINNISITP